MSNEQSTLKLTPEIKKVIDDWDKKTLDHVLNTVFKEGIKPELLQGSVDYAYDKWLKKPRPQYTVIVPDLYIAAYLIRFCKDEWNSKGNIDAIKPYIGADGFTLDEDWLNSLEMKYPNREDIKKDYSDLSSYFSFSDRYHTESFELGKYILKNFDNRDIDNQDITDIREKVMSVQAFGFFYYEALCIAVQPPQKVYLDEQNRLHSSEGGAVIWRTGRKQYFMHGRVCDAFLIENTDEITEEMFLGEQDEDRKGMMYEILGQERIFKILDLEKVKTDYIKHNYGNEEVTLYQSKRTDPTLERDWGRGNNRYKFVHAKCPSTHQVYLLGVPPTATCPIEGVASTFGKTKEEYILDQAT